MKEINLNGNFFITNIRITNNYDVIISLSNGTICIYNHSNKNPEYYFIYHHQKLTNFIWLEKQKSIISVSLDRSIKIYQIPLKWPAELIRKDKRINLVNIIRDMIGETKNIFYELEYKNKTNNQEETNFENNFDKSKENDENTNDILKKKYIWDIGNLNINNSKEKYEDEENPKNYNMNDNNLLYSNDDNNIKNADINVSQYNKNNFDTYHEYFYIFSDDLDGWSE